MQISQDEVYANGTRLRTYTNGTVAFLRFDLSVASIIQQTAFNFSKWIDCDDDDTLDAACTADSADVYGASFTNLNNAVENSDDYWKVRVFNNNTVWWYLRRCFPASVSTPDPSSVRSDCGTLAAADRLLLDATQIDYYVTVGTIVNSSRIVYHVNGSVTRETWSWTTERVRVVN